MPHSRKRVFERYHLNGNFLVEIFELSFEMIFGSSQFERNIIEPIEYV